MFLVKFVIVIVLLFSVISYGQETFDITVESEGVDKFGNSYFQWCMSRDGLEPYYCDSTADHDYHVRRYIYEDGLKIPRLSASEMNGKNSTAYCYTL